MPLRVIDTYFACQTCLVYTGKLEGKIGKKRQLYRGRLDQLPKLPRSKRFNLRIRGRDEEGNYYHPLQCHARTDGAGDLYITDRDAPFADKDQALLVPPEPEIPLVMPQPTLLAKVVSAHCRNKR